jgi:hypothetical protein
MLSAEISMNYDIFSSSQTAMIDGSEAVNHTEKFRKNMLCIFLHSASFFL